MDGTDPAGLSPGNAGSPDESVDLLDLALILAARKRFIFLFSFVVAVLTAIVVLIIPVTYTATTTFLPPQQQESSAMAMLGQLSGLASLAGGGAANALGLKNPRRPVYWAAAKRTCHGWHHPTFRPEEASIKRNA